MVKISQPLSDSLNFIRWVAAFLVVIGHLRSLIFVEFNAVENKNILLQFFYFLTSLGHEAVIVFFVLSGFLVGGKLWSAVKLDTFRWKEYLIQRMTRLYVVLMPALIIGGMFDILGVYFFNDTQIYNNAFHLSSLGYDARSHLNMTFAISNLFMLQESFSPTFGSNGPLWSLAYEFWYYLLFPVLLTLVIRKRDTKELILYLVIFIIILVLLHRNILIYFPIWILGAAIFSFHKKVIPTKYAVSILIVVLLAIKIKIFFPYQLGDLTLAISLGLLILSFKDKQEVFSFEKYNHLFADFSFSLYLVHYPFILFVIAFLLSIFGFGIQMQPNFESLSFFTALLLLVYGYAYLFYLLFEAHTNKIRAYLLKRFSS